MSEAKRKSHKNPRHTRAKLCKRHNFCTECYYDQKDDHSKFMRTSKRCRRK